MAKLPQSMRKDLERMLQDLQPGRADYIEGSQMWVTPDMECWLALGATGF
jgi:hypothetical protein